MLSERPSLWPFLVLAGVFGLSALLGCGQDAAWSACLRIDDGHPAAATLHAAVDVVKVFGRGEVLVLVALLLGALGRRRTAVQILIAALIVAVAVTALKHGVDRIRPNGGPLSFPSGDTATAFAIAVPLAVLGRWWLGVPALLVAVLVGLGRVVQGWHYPSDALAGAALGILAGVAALRFSRNADLRSATTPEPPIGSRSGWAHWCERLLAIPWRWWLGAAIAYAGIGSLLVLLFGGANDRVWILVFLAIWGPALGLLIFARWLRARSRRSAAAAGPGRWRIALLLAGLVAAYALIAAATTLWDRDEPRNAKAALEMIERGDYVVPHLNGELRLHKPVLAYWLMAGSTRVFGLTDWAVRLPAILGAAVSVFATWWILRRLTRGPPGQEAAPAPSAAPVYAALVFACTPLLMISGTAATHDAWLVASICLAMAAFIYVLVPREGIAVKPCWGATVVLGVALGLAQLAKGPVGLLVPLLAIGGAWALLGRQARLGRIYAVHLLVAVLIGIGAFLAWAIPANNATGGEFAREGLGRHVLYRIGLADLADRLDLTPHGEPPKNGMEGHGGPIFYYVPVLLGTFFPWVALLPLAVVRLWRRRLGSPQLTAVVLAWFVPAFVVVSLATTKLPHYLLPAFPALALAVGAVLAGGALDRTERRALALGWWVTAAVMVVGGLGLVCFLMVPWFVWWPGKAIPIPGAVAPAAAAGLVLLALALTGRRAARGQRLPLLAQTFVAGLAMLMLVLCALAAPAIERIKPAQPIAEAIRSRTPATVPVAVMDQADGFDEASLYFHLNRTPVERLRGWWQVLDWRERPGPGVIVVTASILAEAEKGLAERGVKSGDREFHPLGLDLIAQVPGFNYASGRPVVVIALGRNLPRP